MNATATESKSRLDYIDGLRALAALAVMISHTLGNCGGLLASINGKILIPHFAVDLFIVLSGYCLMLPVLSRGIGTAAAFYQRRFLRIYPAYIASVVIGAALFVCEGGKVTLLEVIRHLFMITDWEERGNHFNGVVWTVCVEAHCYILFPVLIAIWKKMRYWLLVPVACVSVPLGIIAEQGTHFRSCPQYLLLFVFGMIAASISRQTIKIAWLPWIVLIGMAAGLIITNAQSTTTAIYYSWAYSDLFIGAACAILLVFTSSNMLIQSVLSYYPLVWLGSFSFSLYLVHCLVIRFFRMEHISVWATPWGAFSMDIAVSIIFGYGFACIFEKRYIKPLRFSKSTIYALLPSNLIPNRNAIGAPSAGCVHRA